MTIRRRRGTGWVVALAVAGGLVASACAGTSAPDGPSSSGAPSGSTPAPTVDRSAAAGTALTAPAAGLGPARPFDAAAPSVACTLQAGRPDLGDLPVDRLPPIVGSLGEAESDVPDPFGEAPGFAIGLSPRWVTGLDLDAGRPEALDPEGRWLALGRLGATRVDPSSGAVVAVTHVGEDCWIHALASSGDRLAAVVCPEPFDVAEPGPCALVVTGAGGEVVGRSDVAPGWQLAWAGDQVVAVAAEGDPAPTVLALDPATGVGAVRTVTGCEPGTATATLVPRSAVVVVGCGYVADGAPRTAVDATSGAVVQERVGDGAPPGPADAGSWPLAARRVDASTGAELASSVPPEVRAALVPSPDQGVIAATETPTGLWIERCVGPCPESDQVELTLADLDGRPRRSWTLAARPAGAYRGQVVPQAHARPVYDATGAWVAVDGRVVRLSSVG